MSKLLTLKRAEACAECANDGDNQLDECSDELYGLFLIVEASFEMSCYYHLPFRLSFVEGQAGREFSHL
jgi:hypothetical protein